MEKTLKVYGFCREKCCPVVVDNGTEIVIGEEKTENGLGGFTAMSRQQFKDFVDAAKAGKFDEVL
jgi:hypothetical protein